MKKRILSLLMAVVFCMLSMGMVSVSALELTTITVGSVVDVAPGDIVEVPVYISNNGDDDPDNRNYTGLAGLTLNIKYDANVLAYKSATQGDALGSFDFTKPKRDFVEGDIIFNWDSTDCDNTDGEILVMTFEVASNAPDGDYTIDVDVDAACDYDLMDVETRTVAGIVYVDGTPEPTPIPDDITTITVGSVVDVAPGDIVEVPVYISNNGDDDPDNRNYTGLAGLILNIKYDSDVFAYKSAAKGDALSTLDLTKPGKDFTEGDLRFWWDSNDSDNTDGEILVITFEVSETATYGDYTIDVNVVVACDFDVEDVETATVDGTVTIGGPVVTPTPTANPGIATVIDIDLPLNNASELTWVQYGVTVSNASGIGGRNNVVKATGLTNSNNNTVGVKLPDGFAFQEGDVLTYSIDVYSQTAINPDMWLRNHGSNLNPFAIFYNPQMSVNTWTTITKTVTYTEMVEASVESNSTGAFNTAGNYALYMRPRQNATVYLDNFKVKVTRGGYEIPTPTPTPTSTPRPTPTPTPIPDGVTTITVINVDAAQGETIEVPVYISNNGDDDPDNDNCTGLSGLTLNIKYDANVLAYKSATQGDALSALDLTKPGRDFEEGDLTFNWDSTDPDNTDGEILVIKFDVAEDAPNGYHTIDVTVDAACDYDLCDVETAAVDGTVTIDTHKHEWDDGTITTLPTHSTSGVKTYTCSTCGDKKTETIPAIGHSYSSWKKADDTYHKKTCSCGDVITGTHYWYYSTITTVPTCTKTGIRTYTCSTCNGTKTEVIPANGHNTKLVAKVEPTCTKTGTKQHYKCLTCGKIFEDASGKIETVDIVIPAKGHSYGQWVTDGYTTHSKLCPCGDVVKEAHNWNEGIVTTVPTYRKTGVKTYTCLDCKGIKRETVEKLTAKESDINIIVGNATERHGKEITVPITISKNVGISGLQLMLEYDADVLTLIAVEKGDALSKLDLTKPGDFNEDYLRFTWDGVENDTSNGDIAYLKFMIAEDADVGEYELILDADIACDENLDDIPVYLVNGMVNVIEYKPGDANDDGVINVRDVIVTRRYITKGYDVTIIEKAADVNKDYVVNVKDVINLRRYITKGYDIELK